MPDAGELPGLHERALETAEALNIKPFVATVLSSIGNVLNELARHGEAALMLKRALALREALGDVAGIGRTVGNLGVAQLKAAWRGAPVPDAEPER